MLHSDQHLDAYALAHLVSAMGDAMVVIALADSVFFSVKVGDAKLKVALYLAFTVAPLAVASPALVWLLDRGGFLRLISFAVSAGRAGLAVFAAPRFSTALLFPLAFGLLVLSRANGVAKNSLVMAYAPSGEGLVSANARLGRLTAIGGVMAAPLGLAFLKLGGARSVLYLAAVAYAVTMLLTLRLPPPGVVRVRNRTSLRGGLPALGTASVGTAGLKAASGFLFFLLAFALRGSERPAYWFGILALSAAAGGFLGDVTAPHLSRRLREELVVFGAAAAAGVAALFAFARFELLTLALFALSAGAATEFGRLAFQSLMQRLAPPGGHGRIFVRYEMIFQLAWVAGAFFSALIAIPFRVGVMTLAVFYLAIGAAYLGRTFIRPVAGRVRRRLREER
jgi:hypothetical protein